MRLVVLLLLALFSAKTFSTVPVRVEADSADATGKVLTAVLKGKIAESKELSLNGEATARLELHLITMDQFTASPGIATIYSSVVTWKNPDQDYSIFMGQYAGFCGSDRVELCADGLLVKLIEQANRIKIGAESDRAAGR